jgi:hypothetical protein
MPAQRDLSLSDSSSYRAYLVRLWKDGRPPTWRASAQVVKTGEIIRFAALAELFDFLAIETIGSKADDDCLT